MKIVPTAKIQIANMKMNYLEIAGSTVMACCTAPVPYDDYESTDEGDYLQNMHVRIGRRKCSKKYIPQDRGMIIS